MLRERRTPEGLIRCGFVDSGNELDTYGELGVFPGKYQTRPSLPLTEQWYLLSLEIFSLFVSQYSHRCDVLETLIL